MATPSLFPQFLKAQGGGGSVTFNRINLDELLFTLEPEAAAVLETTELAATLAAEVVASLETTVLTGSLVTEIKAGVVDEFAGEVDC